MSVGMEPDYGAIDAYDEYLQELTGIHEGLVDEQTAKHAWFHVMDNTENRVDLTKLEVVAEKLGWL